MSRRRLLNLVLAPAIILVALLSFLALVKTRPSAKRSDTRETSTLVRVMTATRGTQRIMIAGLGTVIPARDIILEPEVAGRIVEQSPKLIPGGFFSAGEVVARIDPRDYELAVEQQKANVARAEFEMKLEAGRRAIAEREWKLLEGDITSTRAGRDLALRRPHMQNAKAALAAARSGLERAELDLERATIRAPFNAMVTDEFIDVGQIVSSQTRLATLIGTDSFRVQASVPIDQLDSIILPHSNRDGSLAHLVQEVGLGRTIEREGRVLGLRRDLDPKGRMARVLVAIDDPLDLRSIHPGEPATDPAGPPRAPLFIGAYVRVEIEGKELANVISVPRLALRAGDKLWIMDSDGRLAIRNVEIAWRYPKSVLVGAGLEDDERIVVTPISAPIPGMRLRLDGTAATALGPGAATTALSEQARDHALR